MSGKGDCYDNAMVGMFFKVEIRAGLAHRPSIRAQAKNRLAGYIDGFYNPIQRYSSLTFPQPGTVRKTRPRVLRQCLSTLRNKSRFTHDVGGAVRRRPPARSRPPIGKGVKRRVSAMIERCGSLLPPQASALKLALVTMLFRGPQSCRGSLLRIARSRRR
jgi:putative transposase